MQGDGKGRAPRVRWGSALRRLAGAGLLTATAACGAGGGTPASRAPDPAAVPERVSAEEAVEVFDSAWSRIYHTYYDTTFNGIDWVAVGDELRPAARDAGTADSLRAVITTMLERLGESHFVVVPARVADALDPDSVRGTAGEPGDVGVAIRVVDGALVVTAVRPDGPADRAGVRPGWAVAAIDGEPATEILTVLDELPGERRLAEARIAWAVEARLAGSVADTIVVRFETGRGETLERPLVSGPVPGTPVRFGNLPTMFADLRWREVPLRDGCAGVIAFDVWMTPILPRLETAVQELRHCRGVVLDIRGNPGGVAGMVMSVSGWFMDERRPLGRLITRQNELRLVSMPRRVTSTGEAVRPFDGPLALLVDGQSMSTSEIFAAGLQEVGRARVFGETSGGQALPAMMMRLPNDDVLMYVFANLVTPDGVRIEGRGVVPDRTVPYDREQLLAGQDAALAAALEWIDSHAGAERADQH